MGYTYTGDPNHVAVVQIPYTLGKNRYDWVKQGDLSNLAKRPDIPTTEVFVWDKKTAMLQDHYVKARQAMVSDLSNPNSQFYIPGTEENTILTNALNSKFAVGNNSNFKINSYQDLLHTMKDLATQAVEGRYIPPMWKNIQLRRKPRTGSQQTLGNNLQSWGPINPKIKDAVYNLATVSSPTINLFDDFYSKIMPMDAVYFDSPHFLAAAADNPNNYPVFNLFAKSLEEFRKTYPLPKTKNLFDNIPFGDNRFSHTIFYGELGKPVLKLKGTMAELGIDPTKYTDLTRAHRGAPSPGLSKYNSITSEKNIEQFLAEYHKYLKSKTKK